MYVLETVFIFSCVFGNTIMRLSGHSLKQNCFRFASFSYFEMTQIVSREKKKTDAYVFLKNYFLDK